MAGIKTGVIGKGNANRVPNWCLSCNFLWAVEQVFGVFEVYSFEVGNEYVAANKAPALNPANGLYRYYHLLVAYLMDVRGRAVMELYEVWPEEESLINELKVLEE